MGAVNAHSLGIGAIPNSGGQRFTGEIKDVRIHNRALEDTEVAAAYNGESTPWKYAKGGTTVYSNDYASGIGGWLLYNAGATANTVENSSGTAKFVADSSGANFNTSLGYMYFSSDSGNCKSGVG